MQPRAAAMRTSDAERQRVADFLRDACGAGRLSPEELEERLEQLFAGSTVADIAVLVRDLPGGGAVVPRLGRAAAPRRVAPVPARRRAPAAAVAGGADRRCAAHRRWPLARSGGAAAAGCGRARRSAP